MLGKIYDYAKILFTQMCYFWGTRCQLGLDGVCRAVHQSRTGPDRTGPAWTEDRKRGVLWTEDRTGP